MHSDCQLLPLYLLRVGRFFDIHVQGVNTFQSLKNARQKLRPKIVNWKSIYFQNSCYMKMFKNFAHLWRKCYIFLFNSKRLKIHKLLLSKRPYIIYLCRILHCFTIPALCVRFHFTFCKLYIPISIENQFKEKWIKKRSINYICYESIDEKRDW